VEYIFGKSLHLDKQKFLAKWVNYPKSQHTAEPFENLELNNTEAIYRYERAHFYHTLQQHVYNRQYDGKMVRIESTSMRVV
jgi:hypothetical protein